MDRVQRVHVQNTLAPAGRARCPALHVLTVLSTRYDAHSLRLQSNAVYAYESCPLDLIPLREAEMT